MKDLLLYILQAIVDDQDAISIDEVTDETGLTTFNVTVAESDMGKVIGKAGKVINAIRQVVKIKAIKEGKRVNISLGEPKNNQPIAETEKLAKKSEKKSPKKSPK